jgi:hypothetical protein
VRIEVLEIDDHIRDKIASRHAVSHHEIREACYSADAHWRRGREGLYELYSRTDEGRYLLVILARKDRLVWRIVTARDMTRTERRLYQRAVED